MAEPTAWKVTPAHPSDLPDIGRCVKRSYSGRGGYGSMDLYQWKVIANYLRAGVMSVVKSGSTIVSTLSMAPRKLFVRGEPVGAAEVVDAYTDPDFQRQGMFALLLNENRRQMEEQGMHFIYATPNPLSLSGFKDKGHFADVEPVDLRMLGLLIHLHPVLRRVPWIVGAALDWLFSSAVYLGLEATRPLRRLPSDAQVEVCDGRVAPQWPAAWNTFWQNAMRPYGFIFARDWDAIHWRYFQNPNTYCLLVARRGAEIVGYLVYRIKMDPESTSLLVADFLALPGQEGAVSRCLDRALRDAYRAGVSALSVWCPADSPYFKVFTRFGFINRKPQPMVYYPNDTSMAYLQSCRTWHFTVGDTDNA